MFFDSRKFLNNYFTKCFAVQKIDLHLFMAKKKNNGGRKPLKPSERAILVGFYIKSADVDFIGGIEKAREIAKVAVQSAVYDKMPKAFV
jgi:hypothetical protein